MAELTVLLEAQREEITVRHLELPTTITRAWVERCLVELRETLRPAA